MLNVKSAYTEYGSVRSTLWRRAHQVVFRPLVVAPIVIEADAPQCALDNHFDIENVMTGYNGYRIRWKTD